MPCSYKAGLLNAFKRKTATCDYGNMLSFVNSWFFLLILPYPITSSNCTRHMLLPWTPDKKH